MTAPSANFFYGGACLIQNAALTDVYFQPLVARQILNAQQWNIQAARNDAVLMTAEAYFSVHQHRGMYAGALYCVERGHDLTERIAQLSRELVPRNVTAAVDPIGRRFWTATTRASAVAWRVIARLPLQDVMVW
jgi:hypothetical protein